MPAGDAGDDGGGCGGGGDDDDDIYDDDGDDDDEVLWSGDGQSWLTLCKLVVGTRWDIDFTIMLVRMMVMVMMMVVVEMMVITLTFVRIWNFDENIEDKGKYRHPCPVWEKCEI